MSSCCTILSDSSHPGARLYSTAQGLRCWRFWYDDLIIIHCQPFLNPLKILVLITFGGGRFHWVTPHCMKNISSGQFKLTLIFVVPPEAWASQRSFCYHSLFYIPTMLLAVHLVFKLSNTNLFGLSSQEGFFLMHNNFSMAFSVPPLFLSPFKIGLLT